MSSNITRRHVLATLPLMLSLPAWAQTPAPKPADWARTLQAARGQTVYFNAWAGSERINAYLSNNG